MKTILDLRVHFVALEFVEKRAGSPAAEEQNVTIGSLMVVTAQEKWYEVL